MYRNTSLQITLREMKEASTSVPIPVRSSSFLSDVAMSIFIMSLSKIARFGRSDLAVAKMSLYTASEFVETSCTQNATESISTGADVYAFPTAILSAVMMAFP